MHILDTKPDPKNPRLVRTVSAQELAERANYARPYTVHCGPGGGDASSDAYCYP